VSRVSRNVKHEPFFSFTLIGTNMLRNPARFRGHDLGVRMALQQAVLP